MPRRSRLLSARATTLQHAAAAAGVARLDRAQLAGPGPGGPRAAGQGRRAPTRRRSHTWTFSKRSRGQRSAPPSSASPRSEPRWSAGDWRAAAWYLERRFPGHWRPGADTGARDEQDAAAAHAADQAASEELLAKLQRLAEAEERDREDAAAGTSDPGEKRGRPADVARRGDLSACSPEAGPPSM